MFNKIIHFSSRSVILHATLWSFLAMASAAFAQEYPSLPKYEARPLAIGTSIVRQPGQTAMNALSGNNYFVDWNFTPNFAVEGKFEQASAPPCNNNENQIMSYKAYEVGIQGSFSAKFLRPSVTGYFGSGWVRRRESGTLWIEPNTALLGLTVGFDANLSRGSTLRVGLQSSRWIPFWLGSTSKNTNYLSVGVVHRFNASFGREWR